MPTMGAAARALAALLALLRLPAAAAQFYSHTCLPEEVSGEVQGEDGFFCAPRCAAGTMDCPTGVPAGTSAQPQCMLQDADMVPHCSLLCQYDMQCPSGSVCKRIADPPVGICMYALSFGDWVLQRRSKFAVGWPAGAGGSAAARAYGALQNLKRKYGIGSGDPDVLAVTELLSSAAAAPSRGAPAAAQPGVLPSVLTSPVIPGAQPSPTLAAQEQHHHPGGLLSSWRHDIGYFTSNLLQGPAGVEREIHDTVWNIEHIEDRGVASELLRGLVLIAIVYICAGCAYKAQVLGSRGIDMIPQVAFWLEYPRLVSDGWAYVWILFGELFGLQGTFARGRSANRDDFINFKT